MHSLRRILLVEDSPRDAELILDALKSNKLANEVVHLWDGAAALDYSIVAANSPADPTSSPPWCCWT